MIGFLKDHARIYSSSLTGREKALRIVSTAAGELWVTLTLIFLLARNDLAHIDICISSFFLALMPVAVEFLIKCKMRFFIYVSSYVYAFNLLLGECYRMYYSTVWWDKVSHVVGGMVCAMYGFYILRRLCKNDPNRLACALFALFFSVTVAAAWEYLEYAGDCLFGMDTQNDVIVHEINSYVLPTETGVPGTIKDIKAVTLDGEEFPFDGYLDIGLHDSMQDMLVETAGAILAMTIILVDKDKHVLIASLEDDERRRAPSRSALAPEPVCAQTANEAG